MKRRSYYKKRSWQPHPADFAILERLPLEGSLLGYHVLAATVKQMVVQLNKDVPEEGRLTTDQIHSRLRSMRTAELVVDVPVMGAGGARGWQRTRKGELVYAEHTGRTLANGGLTVVEGREAS